MAHSSSHSSSVVPFLSSLLSTSPSSSNNHRRLDGAIGAAATIGLSIMILKLVGEALKSARNTRENSPSINIVKEVLKGLLFQRSSTEEQDENSDEESTEHEMVLHKGSCHCRAVTFELAAPKTLQARHGPGKISYAHTRVCARNFDIINGKEYVSMYYVSVPAGMEQIGVEPTKGAHTFCHRCGVHILHAPSPNSNVLHVNVSCVDTLSKPKIVYSEKNSSLSNGVAVQNQWEDDDDVMSMTKTSAWIEDETVASSFTKPDTPDIPSSEYSWKSANMIEHPGTPSTVATMGTDSVLSAMRAKSQVLEQHDDSISLPPPSSKASLLPPLHTSSSLSSSRSVAGDSPSRKTPTNSIMQLKYHLSKYASTTTGRPKEDVTSREN